MRQLNVSMLFVCCAALLFVFACADTAKKEAEKATPAQAAEETTETPSQTVAASIEEVTLTVTGMT